MFKPPKATSVEDLFEGQNSRQYPPRALVRFAYIVSRM